MTTRPLCLDCNAPFVCSVPKGKLVVTGCFHAYCIGCLKDWVASIEKPCPLCRKSICKIRSGKDFAVIWNIFLKIFEKSPSKVWDILKKNEDTKDNCSSCLEDFPSLSIRFDIEKKGLKHMNCGNSFLPEITVRDVIKVVEMCSSEDKKLHDRLTPSGPSYLEKIPDYVKGLIKWLNS